MCKTTYYVVEYQYIGHEEGKDDLIHIQTTPARDLDGNVCTDGWCETWGDWAVYAHGEYVILNDARAAVREKFGDVREVDGSYGPAVIETYKVGLHEPLNSYESYEYCLGYIQADVNRDTTDERIDELVAEYEIEANWNGYTLDADGLAEMIRDYRDELRDELASDNAPD